jgi:hypothetical protein
MPIDLIDHLISKNVPKHLRLYCNGDRGVRTVDILVDASRYICTTRMCLKLKLTARNEGVSDPRDLATSAIAELFRQDHPETPLAKALDGIRQSDRDLTSRFTSVIYVHTSRWLYHRLRDNDTQGFNITRSARRALHDKRLKAWPYDRPEFVSLAGTDELRQSAESWEYNDVLELCFRHLCGSSNASEWLVAVLREANDATKKQAVIRVSILMLACREASKQVSGQQFAEHLSSGCENPALTIDLEKAHALALEEARAKISWYYSHKKVDSPTRALLELAVADYLNDLVELIPNYSEYDYLKLHNSELTRPEYRNSLHSIFNEITKVLRRAFADALS